MTFDRPTVKTTRERLQTALDAVAAELGCEIKVGGATFESDGSRCCFKVDCAVAGEDGTVETKEASDFALYAAQFKLSPEDLGREFTKGGKTFTVIGCKPKSYKFPILARRQDGKVFKFPAVVVRLGLDRCSTFGGCHKPTAAEADPERAAEKKNALLG